MYIYLYIFIEKRQVCIFIEKIPKYIDYSFYEYINKFLALLMLVEESIVS